MKFVFVLLVILAGIALLIYWARGPQVSEKQFPSSQVINYKNYESNARRSIPDRLTVVTYNMGFASADKNNKPVKLVEEEIRANLDAMVAELQKLKPDLIFLQEVDFNAARTFGIDQMRYLVEGLEMPFAAYVITWNRRYLPWPFWPPSVHYGRMLSGQAVLSRFPIQGQSAIRFEKPASNPFWYNWFYLDRIAQRVSLTVGDDTWNVWNLHLEAFDPSAREQQFKQVIQAIRKDTRAVIAAGDYNEQKADVLQDFGQKIGFSSYGHYLDYIFFADGLDVVEKGYQDIEASDHWPVWARFKVTE